MQAKQIIIFLGNWRPDFSHKNVQAIKFFLLISLIKQSKQRSVLAHMKGIGVPIKRINPFF